MPATHAILHLSNLKPATTRVLAVILLGAALSCADDSRREEPGDQRNTDPLVLKNLGITLAAYDSGTGRAGDLIFDPSFNKVFLEFGVIVPSPSGDKRLAEFTFHPDALATVRAPADGYITGLSWQDDSMDYEIWIQNQLQNNRWMLVVDHISDPVVAPGERVQAGVPLGKPGIWGTSVGRFEIMLTDQDTNAYWAPFAHFDPSLRAEYEDRIWQLMAAWEAFKGDTGLYHQDAMQPHHAGCLADVYYD